MRRSEEVLATEACFQASSPARRPLVGSLCRFCRAMVRKADVLRQRGKSVSKPAAGPPPSPYPPSGIHTDDDPTCRYHWSLAQKLRPSLSSICDWLAKDDIQIVGGRPVSAGGFADIWRGSLNAHEVAVKSYRRYLSFNPPQVYLVNLPGLASRSSCH